MSAINIKTSPILFRAEMVRAILEGRKTQTRRLVKPQPSEHFLPTVGWYHPTRICNGEYVPGKRTFGASDTTEDYPSPYAIGNLLWVKETWSTHNRDVGNVCGDDSVAFRADSVNGIIPGLFANCRDLPEKSFLWRPSIFMPSVLSRITLEITGVRCERLQNITEADAKAENAEPLMERLMVGREAMRCPEADFHANLVQQGWTVLSPGVAQRVSFRAGFERLWKSIHGPESWEANPWVWVIEFRKL